MPCFMKRDDQCHTGAGINAVAGPERGGPQHGSGKRYTAGLVRHNTFLTFISRHSMYKQRSMERLVGVSILHL